MKERPILFSGPMVRAILEGRKTQTRRIVKPQPPMGCGYIANESNNAALCYSLETDPRSSGALWVPPTAKSEDHRLPCPYGQPGDRLWVREAFAVGEGEDEVYYRATDPEITEEERAEGMRWLPSIHMPRWASRLTLEITEIRVERLNAITDEDAGKEGVSPVLASLGTDDLSIGTIRNYLNDRDQKEGKAVQYFTGKNLPRARFASLWQSINGPDSWEANPWVLVVSFRPVSPTPSDK
jgi:hypothetical protein